MPQNLDYNRLLRQISATAGTVSSVGISGSDGISVDGGSPITSSGSISLSVDKVALALLLAELADVTLTSPSSGQVLTYDGAEWINSNPANTGGSLEADGGAASTTFFDTYLDGGASGSTYSFFHVIDGGTSG